MDSVLHFIGSNQYLVAFLEIFLAMCLGCFIGVERTIAGKMAGVRTYGLVAMGSCLLIVISEMVLDIYPNNTIDPLRLAAGLITGIGFLGAGLIIFKDSRLSGLTTAAGLWIASGIGMAVGFGLYSLSVFVTFLTLFNFTALWSIESKIKNFAHKDHSDL